MFAALQKVAEIHLKAFVQLYGNLRGILIVALQPTAKAALFQQQLAVLLVLRHQSTLALHDSVSFLIDGQEYSFSRIKSDGTSDGTESTESEKTDTESESSDSDDDEQWVCDNDTSLKINTSKVTSLLGNATSITASKKFDSDADTSDFGLDEPQNVVKLSIDDKTYTITIGEKNAMLGEYYIKVNDDVYLSSTTILGTIPDSIDDMIATKDSESTETESE